MSQNIYDDPEFFAGYATLDRSVKGLDGAPEWPTIQAMLPSLQGKNILDGTGYFTKNVNSGAQYDAG